LAAVWQLSTCSPTTRGPLCTAICACTAAPDTGAPVASTKVAVNCGVHCAEPVDGRCIVPVSAEILATGAAGRTTWALRTPVPASAICGPERPVTAKPMRVTVAQGAAALVMAQRPSAAVVQASSAVMWA
jgi:hypothetical protein